LSQVYVSKLRRSNQKRNGGKVKAVERRRGAYLEESDDGIELERVNILRIYNITL
jgi:hypothetical protein